jgi:hypothetical protein
MRSRAGHCLGRLAAATGAAWLVCACTVVVPLVGVNDRDGSAAPSPDRGASPGSEPPSVSPTDPPPTADGAPATPGDDGGPPAVCSADEPVPLKLVLPQVIIALDRSARMVDSRVEAIRFQLLPALALIDKAVQFGYLEFPDRSCDGLLGGCCGSTDVLVPPAKGTGATIGLQLACNANGRTCGTTGPRRTPTGDALKRIGDYYSQHLTPGSPDQFAVVITIGEPSCGGQDGVCRETSRVAGQLWTSGVKTAILGIGIDASPGVNTCLPEIADAGGRVSGSPNGQQADYPWAPETDAMKLRQAIDQIMAPIKSRACVVKLAGFRDRQADVTVSVNGAAVKFDRLHMDGWDFESGRQVRIWGPRCDDILAGRIDPKLVEAVVMCKFCNGKLDCG